MIGRVLGGRYAVEERVGGGGMATVYRGMDTLLDRPVALKVLRTQLSGDPEFVRRFRREARAAASLSHPHIIAVYDVGSEDGDCHYIVQEFVDGETLKDRINREGPLPPPEALRVMQQVLDALAHAHRVGVVHRDVKPQNVLLTRDGRAKVTDFGIALAEVPGDADRSFYIVGTAHYAAPEQVRGEVTDARSDIYSAGVMLYEMLSGVLPFPGERPVAVAVQQVTAQAPDLSQLRPLPPGFSAVVAHALRKAPEERYRSASEFREDIDALAAGGAPLRAQTPPAGAPPPEPPVGPAREPVGMLAAATAGGGQEAAAAGRADGPPSAVLGAEAGRPGGARRGAPAARPSAPPAAGASVTPAGTRPPGRPGGTPAEGPPGGNRRRRRRRILASAVAGVIGVAVLATAVAAGGRALRSWADLGTVTVPSLTGQPASSAEVALRALGLPWTVTSEHAGLPAGEVVQLTPTPGTVVRPGRQVQLLVSLGPAVVVLPDVVGLSEREAAIELTGTGLAVHVSDISEYSSSIPAGFVVSSTPSAGTHLTQDASVRIVLSAGPAPLTNMPDYVGQPETAVSGDLAGRHLVLGRVLGEPTGWPAGIVAATTPVAGARVTPGSSVTLIVSTGCLYTAPLTLRAGVVGAGRKPGAPAPGAKGAKGVMHETVLMQDVGEPQARAVFAKSVLSGHSFRVHLCWSSTQGASWTWQENGVVRESGQVGPAASAASGTTAAVGGGGSAAVGTAAVGGNGTTAALGTAAAGGSSASGASGTAPTTGGGATAAAGGNGASGASGTAPAVGGSGSGASGTAPAAGGSGSAASGTAAGGGGASAASGTAPAAGGSGATAVGAATVPA